MPSPKNNLRTTSPWRSVLQESLGYAFIRHISNSAAVVRNPDLQLDMVRLGIGLYGIDPAASTLLELKEVGTLKTTIAQIKDLKLRVKPWVITVGVWQNNP